MRPCYKTFPYLYIEVNNDNLLQGDYDILKNDWYTGSTILEGAVIIVISP